MELPKHSVFLGLGSNLGDRGENLNQALAHIGERIGKVIASSAFYATEPVGFESGNRFLNAACQVLTNMQPIDILTATQDIEKEMGRDTKSTDGIYADRIIDIDLLLYDNEILVSPQLTLPHPHLHRRHFVLLPLAEIAGSLVHPVLHKTMKELEDNL